MIRVLVDWYERHFSDPQVVLLAILLLLGFGIVLFTGGMLAPLLAAIVLAYLLDDPVQRLTRLRMPRALAVSVVFAIFLGIVTAVLVWLLPLLVRQAVQFFTEMPMMLSQGQKLLLQLPERYPELLTESDIVSLVSQIRAELAALGQRVVSTSLASVVSVITMLVYLVLVPVLIFFLLLDRDKIFAWIRRFLPEDRTLVSAVSAEMNKKIASYVRGKLLEIVIIWAVSYLVFASLCLNYAMLLSLMAGLSVIIPYVGVVIVTVPIFLIGYFQWGWSSEFIYLMIGHGVIQFFDGNLLVPLLFSEVVNLHPIAIIAAVLVFGSLWGVWGVFFAIPLATLVHVVLDAWPNHAGVRDDTAAQANKPG
ncbi:MAG: AI-2E family transporter [Thiotrichales bacterium]